MFTTKLKPISINKQVKEIFEETFRPFCGRVFPQEQLGLVPTKQYGERRTKKRQLPVLNNHKKWLERFKQDIEMKKTSEELEEKRKQETLEKIRQEGRERIKEVTSKEFTSINNDSVINDEIKNSNTSEAPQEKTLTKPQNAHKKKPKPAWAQTEEQHEEHEEEHLDELLDFFQKGEPEQVKDYVNDDDIKKILLELKGKIEVLKEQGGEWKQNELIKIEDENNNNNRDNEERRHKNGDDKDDILSRISKQSSSQSVTSQKTVERVEQLEKKKETKEWDKLTTTSKSSIASVDEQIAKHIADEILRNYPNMKHHSNQSIRKLLEKQAREELKS